MAVVALDHVQVAAPVGAEAAARAFYGVLLGLPEVAKPIALDQRGGVWFAVGAQGLHVGVTGEFAPAQKAHPALRVTSGAALQALAERLEAAGQRVEWAAEAETGSPRFHVSDPWGNRLELLF
jgi:catechol 2,3-dioxygenase-like lactoylglutathione lyase family enzyme